MSLTSRSIVTVAEVDSYLNMTATGSSKESVVEYFIDLCSGMIEEETGRKYAAVATTMYLDGSGGSIQELPYPITALVGDTDAEKLANLQYRDDPDESWADICDDYDHVHINSLFPRQIELLDEDYFPSGAKNIRVYAYVGYSSIPAIIEKTCLEMVALMWKESGQSSEARLGLQSQSGTLGGGTGSTSFRDMWTEVWRPLLGKYRIKNATVSLIDL